MLIAVESFPLQVATAAIALGAVVASVIAAVISRNTNQKIAKFQEQSEHKKWIRDKRVEVYMEFINAADEEVAFLKVNGYALVKDSIAGKAKIVDAIEMYALRSDATNRAHALVLAFASQAVGIESVTMRLMLQDVRNACLNDLTMFQAELKLFAEQKRNFINCIRQSLDIPSD